MGLDQLSITKTHPCNIHFRPVITRWSGSTSRMHVIGEARNANLPSRIRLVAVSVVFVGGEKRLSACLLA